MAEVEAQVEEEEEEDQVEEGVQVEAEEEAPVGVGQQEGPVGEDPVVDQAADPAVEEVEGRPVLVAVVEEPAATRGILRKNIIS